MRHRVGISGTREYVQALVEELAEEIDAFAKDTIVVVGDCPTGIDAYAFKLAQKRGLSVVRFYARWSGEHGTGKRAGPERNGLIAEYADQLIAFPGPDSRGTWDCVEQFERLKKPHREFGPWAKPSAGEHLKP